MTRVFEHSSIVMRDFADWRKNDRELAGHEEPPPGAHLVSPRVGFVHHGIYVGDGKVVHSGGAALGLVPWGPVEEVSLSRFGRGRPVSVRSGLPATFTAQEVIERARSRTGENRYRLLTNNCEHFCEWCLRGRRRSYQVERLTRWIRPWLAVLSRYGSDARARSSGRSRLPAQ